MISIKDLSELIIIVLTVKLVVAKYKPPIQESIQALICIFIGTSLAIFMNPSKEGLITGLVGSGFAFYGEELFNAFKNIKKLKNSNELEEITEGTKKVKDKK